MTPYAPSRAVPARLTEPEFEVETDELFAAMEPPALGVVSPAVRPSICESLMGFALVVLLGVV